jgi:alkanesulfonate monooxygenase SsuD/methylene tetrahydromethanopterin reductase-like flavin-dependent oxidoreductase (luciferase family)
VTPVSFRHPTHTARMAAALDDLSSGRMTLGIGAGWQEREHANYGWDLLKPNERFLRLQEGLEVITKLLKSDHPVDFSGNYYRIHEAILLPRPQRPGGPRILIGGNGSKRTLPLVAQYAQEWNAVLIPPAEITWLNILLDIYIKSVGRQPGDIRRSLMTGCIFGMDENDVTKKVDLRTHGQRSADELRQRGMIVGTAEQIVEQCHQLASVGVQRVMLQWLDLDDADGLKVMANGILDKLSV